MVAVASDTCLLLVKDVINEGRAGAFDVPSGEGFGELALVAESNASYKARNKNHELI